jgi:hypothetical protein
MRSVIFIALFIFSISYAHDGHDDHNAPGTIENGKLKAKDNVTYFDAGAEVQWLGQKLKRKITSNNQIVYQYSDGSKEASPLTSEQDKYLTLKVPGGKVLKAFDFNHAGEMHDLIDVTSPDLNNDVTIMRDQDMRLTWNSDNTSSMIKVIYEVYSATGQLTGRLTLSTNDDGDFSVPSAYLNKLPAGQGKIAIKRIWFGEFQPNEKNNETIGVKSAVSVVGQIKILDN